MVRPAVVLPPTPDERWELTRQLGVTDTVVHTLEIGDGKVHWSYEDLLGLTNWFDDAGLNVSVIEGSIPITERIRLGKEGRDADIAEFKQFLRDCGAVGIPVICYDWMAGIRWARTEAFVKARGDSLATGYDNERMHPGTREQSTQISSAQLWEALEYFLSEVVPVAERADVKLGLHPDDPPRPSVGEIPRIITSPEAYQRVLDCYESPHNGITFCQGNFAAMGVDIPAAIRRFGKKINFIHFRDIEGNKDNFVETWHDNGQTDMLEAMQAYTDAVDETVVMRPDHVPTMAGEDNSNPGYHMKGRLFAIGYMRGLAEQAN
jgi:D-mannonate dehydratase (EC 4.2.1.8)